MSRYVAARRIKESETQTHRSQVAGIQDKAAVILRRENEEGAKIGWDDFQT